MLPPILTFSGAIAICRLAAGVCLDPVTVYVVDKFIVVDKLQGSPQQEAFLEIC